MISNFELYGEVMDERLRKGPITAVEFLTALHKNGTIHLAMRMDEDKDREDTGIASALFTFKDKPGDHFGMYSVYNSPVIQGVKVFAVVLEFKQDAFLKGKIAELFEMIVDWNKDNTSHDFLRMPKEAAEFGYEVASRCVDDVKNVDPARYMKDKFERLSWGTPF